jgi:hypothetical protein
MLRRVFLALPIALLGVFGTTRLALAEFDPTRDELAVGTFLVAAGVMAVLLLIYAVVWYFDLNHPGDPEIPDHAHDHRYANHH